MTQVIRRTFLASKYPKGSEERIALNKEWLTSEYMPSHKYGLFKDGKPIPFTYRTKKEAFGASSWII
jgi:hypothetical protein